MFCLDTATSHLKVAIIDKDNSYGKITTEREILVKKTLMGELDKTILSASCSKTKPPTFRSWTHSGEIIRVTCDDELRLEWLKTKVPTLKTWEGATLAVVRMDELQKLTKASLWITGEVQADLDEKEPTVPEKRTIDYPPARKLRGVTRDHPLPTFGGRDGPNFNGRPGSNKRVLKRLNVNEIIKSKNRKIEKSKKSKNRTTKYGTTIDAVFSRYLDVSYFSYHKPIVSLIKNPE
ncbi:unnamed protein product [Psylliodes chrysocephalus]|uniref:DUF4780 domain-containing protein n=1 Tax=Psylliodes chrysocephalus TaxID=3402493 RepID=A0A9P0GGN9_9CUCU|nr:unnamed protein product [Psylliodes chrysocephala]